MATKAAKKTTRKPAAKAAAATITVIGKLTAEGVECQAMRQDRTRKLFTLVPRSKLKGYKNGDHVKVVGSIVAISFCQQGTTISIKTIAHA